MNRSFRPAVGSLVRRLVPEIDVSPLVGVDADRLDYDNPDVRRALLVVLRVERRRLTDAIESSGYQTDDSRYQTGDLDRLYEARAALSVVDAELRELGA